MRRWLGLVLWTVAAWGQDGGIEVLLPTAPVDAKPELVLQTGHADGITALAYSPDGRRLASSSTDGLVRLWDAQTSRPLGLPLVGSGESVQALAFSPDSRLLAAAGGDSRIWLYDTATRQVHGAPLTGHTATVTGLAFLPDGHTLVSCGFDRTLRRWGVDHGQPLGEPLTGHTNAIQGFALSCDGKLAATGAYDDTVRLWDLATGQAKGEPLRGHKRHCANLAFSRDGSALLSASFDGTVRRWDVATGQPRGEPLAADDRSVTAMALSTDGTTLATAGTGSGIQLRDGVTLRALGAPIRSPLSSVGALAFAPDGRTLAAGDYHGAIALWDVAARRQQGGLLSGRTASVGSIALAPDGRTVVAGYGHSAIRRWDLATGRPLSMPPSPWAVFETTVAASSDGKTVASVGSDGVLLWDLVAGKQRHVRVAGMSSYALGVAFSPDLRTLATVKPDYSVQLFDLDTKQAVGDPLVGHTSYLDCMVFSPDGRLLASAAGDHTIRLWDVAARKPVGEPCAGHTGLVRCLAFSPDGRTLASGGLDGTARLWDVAAQQARGEPLTGHGGAVLSLAWSPDGQTLAAGGRDQAVHVWNVATRQAQTIAVAGPSGLVTALAWSADGRRLLAGTLRGTLEVVSVLERRCLARLLGVDTGTGYVATTPEGYFDGSPDAVSLVNWRLGDEFYPFDQYAAQYNRPERIQQALAGEHVAPEAGGVGVAELPPNVGFIAPRYGAEIAGDTIPVIIEAAGQHPIARLDLTANGKPLSQAASQALQIPQADQTTRTFRLTVPLPPGEPRVRLQAVAYDTASQRSWPAEVTVFRPTVKQTVGTLRVLAVGINQYSRLPAQYQLSYAVPDARSVVEVFAGQGAGQPYASVKTKLLLDDQATGPNMKFALRELKDAATENDVVVIFISGHGLNGKEGTFYFPTHEVDLKDLAGTALSWQDFAAALREVRAKRILLLADTCHSGGIVGPQALNSDLLATRLNREAHQMVFTAAARDEASLGRAEWGHGAFSKALVQGIVGLADADKDGDISFAELRDYVTRRVDELTAGRQHPQLPFLNNFEPEAVVARAAFARTAPASPAEAEPDDAPDGYASVVALAFDPRGQTLAVAGRDGVVRVWKLAGGRPQVLVRSPMYRGNLVFSRAGDKLATSGAPPAIWRIATGEVLGQAEARPTIESLGVAFSPDGSLLATGADDGNARLWDATTGKQHGPDLHHGPYVRAVAFSPDGRELLTCAGGTLASRWSVATGVQRGATAQIQYMGAIGGWYDAQKQARIWGAVGGGFAMVDAAGKYVCGWPGRVYSNGELLESTVSLSDYGNSVAFYDGLARAVEVRRVADGKALIAPVACDGAGFQGPVVALSPDGHLVAYGIDDGHVTVIEVGNGKVLQVLQERRKQTG